MSSVLITIGTVAALLGVTAAIAFGARAVSAWNQRYLRVQREAWERGAAALGLAPTPATDGAIAEMRGQRRGFDVSLALLAFAAPGTEDFVRVRVGGHGRWPATVIVGPQGQVVAPGDSGYEPVPHVDVGLASFDGAFHSVGPRHDVMAVLDPNAREQLVATAEQIVAEDWTQAGSWRVENGVVEWRRSVPDCRPERLLHHLDTLVALARALDRGGRSVQQCLADNTRDDAPPVRARHLAALVAGFPGDAVTLEACRRALHDGDAPTRLVGAKALGREGSATLAALACDEGGDVSLRLEAMAAWEALAPTSDEMAATLDSLLATKSSRVRLASIRAAARLDCAAVLPSLIVLTRYAVDDHARELAITLRHLGDSSTEEALAHLLGSGGEDVQVEVVRALGALGSVVSVEPLLPLATGLLVSRAVKRAAREALRAIRSRLGPADAGRLSLVDLDDASGEVSIADETSGRVSLDDDVSSRGEVPPG